MNFLVGLEILALHQQLGVLKAEHPLPSLPDAAKTTALSVDGDSEEGPARGLKPADGKIVLAPFAVVVVSW